MLCLLFACLLFSIVDFLSFFVLAEINLLYLKIIWNRLVEARCVGFLFFFLNELFNPIDVHVSVSVDVIIDNDGVCPFKATSIDVDQQFYQILRVLDIQFWMHEIDWAMKASIKRRNLSSYSQFSLENEKKNYISKNVIYVYLWCWVAWNAHWRLLMNYFDALLLRTLRANWNSHFIILISIWLSMHIHLLDFIFAVAIAFAIFVWSDRSINYIRYSSTCLSVYKRQQHLYIYSILFDMPISLLFKTLHCNIKLMFNWICTFGSQFSINARIYTVLHTFKKTTDKLFDWNWKRHFKGLKHYLLKTGSKSEIYFSIVLYLYCFCNGLPSGWVIALMSVISHIHLHVSVAEIIVFIDSKFVSLLIMSILFK